MRGIKPFAAAAGFYLAVVALAGTQAWAKAATTFTKISNDGVEVEADTPLGARPDDWACSRDETSGLIWEVKTADGGLRDRRWTYTPFDSNPETNHGWVGYRDSTSGKCARSSMRKKSCNTEAYVEAVNRARLCGFNDWRLPTSLELVLVARRTSNAKPDNNKPTMLPNTADGWYWTGVESVGETKFSRVVLLPVRGQPLFYDGSYMVLLVRSGANAKF